jgi:hypothetical protein
VFGAIEDYTVTNIDFSSLMSSLLEYEYTEDDMYTVPGETTVGEDGYEEYHVDEDAFYDLIIQVFYEEVEEH